MFIANLGLLIVKTFPTSAILGFNAKTLTMVLPRRHYIAASVYFASTI